jgi:hypothetical protein
VDARAVVAAHEHDLVRVGITSLPAARRRRPIAVTAERVAAAYFRVGRVLATVPVS